MIKIIQKYQKQYGVTIDITTTPNEFMEETQRNEVPTRSLSSTFKMHNFDKVSIIATACCTYKEVAFFEEIDVSLLLLQSDEGKQIHETLTEGIKPDEVTNKKINRIICDWLADSYGM